MVYSLGDASKATGKSKPTISKAIKSGRISATKGEDGAYRIDPAELHRVYPVTNPDLQPDTPEDTPVSTWQISTLQAEIATLQEERNRERGQLTDQIEDLRTRLDRSESARERLTAQITDHRDKAAAHVPAPRRSLWQRLTGRGA